MTLPNKLTMIRIFIIPIMIVLCFINKLREIVFFNNFNLLYLLLFILFLLASFTDFLDGYIARKRNLITTFGKFADPLADKMLTFTAMTIFLVEGYLGFLTYNTPEFKALSITLYLIVLIREFMVSGVRMVLSGTGVVIAASKMGKLKTVFTMIALLVLFFGGINNYVLLTGQILYYIAVLLTIISGIEYLYKNRKEILKSM